GRRDIANEHIAHDAAAAGGDIGHGQNAEQIEVLALRGQRPADRKGKSAGQVDKMKQQLVRHGWADRGSAVHYAGSTARRWRAALLVTPGPNPVRRQWGGAPRHR